jgi:Zn-dependent peptidase ImmA (M78 family)
MRLNAGEKRNEPYYLTAVKSRLKWLNYDLHEIPMGSDDFEYVCDQENIIVIRESRKWDGVYFRRKDKDIIYIKSSLTGCFKTFVEFHELTHFWLHQPEITEMQFFNKPQVFISKAEHQASLVSACILIPTILIENLSVVELLESYPNKQIVDFRLQIYRNYRV